VFMQSSNRRLRLIYTRIDREEKLIKHVVLSCLLAGPANMPTRPAWDDIQNRKSCFDRALHFLTDRIGSSVSVVRRPAAQPACVSYGWRRLDSTSINYRLAPIALS
jgi:hypothetical protein